MYRLTGLGLTKTKGCKALGVFSLVCVGVIVVLGGMTPAAMANNLPVSGLLERVNIFTLQAWIFVLSISMVRKSRAKRNV